MLMVISSFLVACGSSTTDSDKEKFEAYLKLKRIPLNDQERYDRMWEDYLQKAALAEAVVNTEKLDMTQIDAEVDEFRKQLLVSRYFDQYLETAVTDQGVQNFYRENINDYKTRKAHVAHILFRINPRMDETERQAVLTAASDAYSKLTAGEDFAELAKALSQDKVSAAKGGDLGWINDGAISEEFSAKAFAMETGSVSEPLLTVFGYHIIKVLEAPQDVTKPLEAVKGDIRYQLRNQSKQAETERLLSTVK